MNIGNIQIETWRGDIDSVQADAKLTACKAPDQDIIRAAAAASLVAAQKKACPTLAISALGCTDEVFPIAGLARIMAQEIMRYNRDCKKPALKKIIFCIKDSRTFQMFDKALRGYVKHVQEKLGPGPYVTVDIIIELKEGIILIERFNPPYGWALPGGFLDYGESLEEAARREAKEETAMDLIDLRQFHTYSKPGRDPRFHTVSTVFIARGKGKPKSGDDAKGLKVVAYKDLSGREYAFDHKQVIKDYLKSSNKR